MMQWVNSQGLVAGSVTSTNDDDDDDDDDADDFQQ